MPTKRQNGNANAGTNVKKNGAESKNGGAGKEKIVEASAKSAGRRKRQWERRLLFHG